MVKGAATRYYSEWVNVFGFFSYVLTCNIVSFHFRHFGEAYSSGKSVDKDEAIPQVPHCLNTGF